MARNIDGMELPQWYDENVMIMLVINPESVFLYWELAFGQVRSVHGRRLVLRLYEWPSNAKHQNQSPLLVRNEETPPLTSDWYFHGLSPARRYRAEIGWINDHRFYSIIRSNIVELPPAVPIPPTSPNRRKSVDTETVPQSVAADQPIRAKVRELIESMSFYMGIRQENRSERK